MLSRQKKSEEARNDENVCLSFDLCENWSVSYQSDETECEWSWIEGGENGCVWGECHEVFPHFISFW